MASPRHGVIGHTDTGTDRISLNLRFGVHTEEQAHEEIGSKWVNEEQKDEKKRRKRRRIKGW